VSKDVVIRFRATALLKRKLLALAKLRDQDLSEYLRQRCIDIVEEYERRHPEFAARYRPAESSDALKGSLARAMDQAAEESAQAIRTTSPSPAPSQEP
jgi:hypothetical protein